MIPFSLIATVMSALFLSVLAVPVPQAHAATADSNFAAVRQQRRPASTPESRPISVHGTLGALAGADGEYSIREDDTGKTFKIISTDAVENLFKAGKRQVAIEGLLRNGDVIEVRQIRQL